MKRLITVLWLVLLAFTASTQGKLLTMEEAVVKQNSTLAPEKLHQLMWIEGSNNFCYLDKNKKALISGNPQSSKRDTLLNLSKLNNSITVIGLKPLETFPLIEWKNDHQFRFETEKKLVSYNLKTDSAAVVTTRDFGNDAENPDMAPVTEYVAFNIKNNLFIYDGNERVNLSNDSNEAIVYGRTVHREEFGIHKGTFWSPMGNLLAFYRMDESMVTDYPIIDWTVRPAKNKNIKYPMAGDSSHQVTVGIYNVKSKKTVYLKTGEPKDQYLTNLTWSPDEKLLYIAVLNRDQNHLKFNCYNAETGSFEKTLFEEKNEKYVHPQHAAEFIPGKAGQFIWQSERDGYNHLYLYSTEGKLLKQLTKGKWVVTDFKGFDARGTQAFFISTAESPVTRNAYSVNLNNGSMSRLTAGEGTHRIILSPDKNYFIEEFQSTAVPREYSLCDIKGKKIQNLFKAENPLKEYALGDMKLFTLKNEKGDDLFCRLYKPLHFDSTKKYPVIVYLYNGPNAQLINNTWNGGGDLWFQYMAERGFVVFTLDGRGSANRGLDFEQAIFRNLGVAEAQDQLTGISFLKEQKWVDQNRMGIFGWSYGGFMSTTFMTHYPNLFKAGVAGGPVIDWSYYEVMYTERYMDTPQSNKNGYDSTSLLNRVDSLKGKLMLIHGTQDPVVVWEQSILFLKACVDKKKQVDYFVYPGYEHNVRGKDREHLYQKVTDYFMLHL